MSRPEVHTNTIAKLGKQGVTSAMLLQLTVEQQEMVVELVESGYQGPADDVDINTLVLGYITRNEVSNVDAPTNTTKEATMKDQISTAVQNAIRNATKSNAATKVGSIIGTVPGAATGIVVKGGVAIHTYWDKSGKDNTIKAIVASGQGFRAAILAAKDIAKGIGTGAKAGYRKAR